MPCKINNLVVDTTAFIKNKALQDLASKIFTVQEVVDEIRNKRQLRNLVVLPYDLEIKEVFPENVQYITEFSKKTGDYPSLSLTDLKVMALTYQLEKEVVGTEHLAKEPQVNRVIEFSKRPSETISDAELGGFYIPSKKITSSCKQESDQEDLAQSEELLQDLSTKFGSLDYKDDGGSLENDDEVGCLVPVKDSCSDAGTASSHNNDTELDAEYDDEDDDDDIGWITVDNIAQVKKEINGDNSDEEEVAVACITADFAMQNVLKQIGLHIVSVDGCQIKQLSTFILRCYGCFKTTSIMTKIFCPNCGNKTLKKVAVSLKEDGTQYIHINSRKPINPRGKKFSLPAPKGGKHASYPHVCEDQRFPHQRPTQLAKMKNNPLDPDYIAGFSPFVMRDVNSRSAMIGVHGSGAKYWMKKNPNEGKRRTRK